MARSMMASMMAWVSMEASQERRRMVSGVASRLRIGVSMSSAEVSKKEITVLSTVRKMETCSAQTARFLRVMAECCSMKTMRSTLGPPW